MFTGLLAGALDGAAKGVGAVADDGLKQQAEDRKRALDEAALRRTMDYKLAQELGVEQKRREIKSRAINDRLAQNVDATVGQVFSDPVPGDAPLTPEQQAAQAEGLRLQRVEKERLRLGLSRRPAEILRAAVETGYAEPRDLVADEGRREVAELRARSSEDIAKLRLEAALAKMDAADKGKPPSGYRATADGNLEAIPGGPADTKLQGQFNADTAQLTGSIAGLDRLADAANRLLTHPGLGGITGLRGKLPNLPGSDAANANALLDNLRSQIGFSVLQSLRDASKTGGALGNVSDKEGARLEANLAALSTSQSEEQFRKSLGQILDFTGQAKDRVREAFNMRHGNRTLDAVRPTDGARASKSLGSGVPTITRQEDLADLPSGAIFRAPDGSLRKVP